MARKFKAPKRSSRAERVEPYKSRYSSQNIRHFKSTKSFRTPSQIGSKEIRIEMEIRMEIRNKMEIRNEMKFRMEIRNIRSQKGSKESRNRLEICELGLKPEVDSKFELNSKFAIKPKFGLISQGDNGEHRPPPPGLIKLVDIST